MRPARLCRAMAAPTLFGRTPLHGVAISCELLIPCLIFVFGADIHSAGSAVLFYIDTDNLRRSVAVQPHGDVAGPLNAVAGWRADGHRKSDRRRGGRCLCGLSLGRNAQTALRGDPDRDCDQGVLAENLSRTIKFRFSTKCLS